MPPDSGGVCMGVDLRNHRFTHGLPPGWVLGHGLPVSMRMSWGWRSPITIGGLEAWRKQGLVFPHVGFKIALRYQEGGLPRIRARGPGIWCRVLGYGLPVSMRMSWGWRSPITMGGLEAWRKQSALHTCEEEEKIFVGQFVPDQIPRCPSTSV